MIARPGIVTISPDEALANGLPPIRLTIDLSGLSGMLQRCVAPSLYLRLSGPPGGTLQLSIDALALVRLDEPAMRALIDEWLASRGSMTINSIAPSSFAGLAAWRADLVCGTSHARACHEIVVMQSPDAGRFVVRHAAIGPTPEGPRTFRAAIAGTALERALDSMTLAWE